LRQKNDTERDIMIFFCADYYFEQRMYEILTLADSALCANNSKMPIYGWTLVSACLKTHGLKKLSE